MSVYLCKYTSSLSILINCKGGVLNTLLASAITLYPFSAYDDNTDSRSAGTEMRK